MLYQVIEDARSEDVNKSVIESAIKNVGNVKELAKPHLLEIKGPGRCAILFEGMVTKRGHMDSLVNPILRKKGGMIEPGLANIFEFKGTLLSVILWSQNFEQQVGMVNIANAVQNVSS